MTKATRKSARKSTPRNTPLPAVTGTVKVLQPIGTVGPAENNTGEIEITGEHGTRRYFIRVAPTCYSLFGFDARKGEPSHYDIAPNCQSCDCPDFVSRAHRREDHACKHCKAVRKLVDLGKLPKIEPPAPAREVEVADYDDSADNYLDDSEADAWHSAYDAA